MKKCPYCRREVEDDAERCPHCYAGLEKQETKEPDTEEEMTPVRKRKRSETNGT